MESSKRRRTGGKNVDFRATGFTNNLRTHRETGNSGVADPHSLIIEKHSCWICQEEMSSEAVLLQHYEHHMTYVVKTIHKVKMRFSSCKFFYFWFLSVLLKTFSGFNCKCLVLFKACYFHTCDSFYAYDYQVLYV